MNYDVNVSDVNPLRLDGVTMDLPDGYRSGSEFEVALDATTVHVTITATCHPSVPSVGFGVEGL